MKLEATVNLWIKSSGSDYVLSLVTSTGFNPQNHYFELGLTSFSVGFGLLLFAHLLFLFLNFSVLFAMCEYYVLSLLLSFFSFKSTENTSMSSGSAQMSELIQ